MDYIVDEPPKKKKTTVRELITILIEEPMNYQVYVTDKNGIEIKGATLCARQIPVEKGFGCLFG